MVSVLFVLFLVSSHLVAGEDVTDPLPTSAPQSHTSTDQSQELVGWVDNPQGRGTSTLLIECVTTIFACTWTVLHLNLPASQDTTKTRVVRKIKWMIITILFPEFIFAKAVCELRLALHTLHQISEQMTKYPHAFTSTTIVHQAGESDVFKLVWAWKAEERQTTKWLHRMLLGNRRSFGSDSDVESAQPGTKISLTHDGWKELPGLKWSPRATVTHKLHEGRDRFLVRPLRITPDPDKHRDAPKAHKTQTWTLSHSYYLNMGGVHGLESPEKPKPWPLNHEPYWVFLKDNRKEAPEAYSAILESPEKPKPWPLKHEPYWVFRGDNRTEASAAYSVIRGDYLANQDSESWRISHPLKDLRLTEDDIKDKSKADWIGRTIAILQIGRLGLDVMHRALTHRTVTQIELATVAFSVFAVITYLINWWKPKDISEPTLLNRLVRENHTPDLVEGASEPFFYRWLFPEPSKGSPDSFWTSRNQQRVENDELWMDGKLPLIWPLMTVSCLLFGGVHCVAWSFQFPTRTEQLIWRVASLISMFLPALALAGTSLIVHSSNGAVISKQIRAASKVVDVLEPLQGLPRHLSAFPTLRWCKPEVSKLPALTLEDCFKGSLGQLGSIMNYRTMLKSSEAGAKIQERNLHAHYKVGTWLLRISDYLDWLEKHCDEYRARLMNDPRSVLGLDFYISTHLKEAAIDTDKESALRELAQCQKAMGVFRICIDGYLQCVERGEVSEYEQAKRDLADKARVLSRPVNLISVVLYTAARIALLGLMFSGLRSVPKEVYETSDWTRYLPSFS